MEKLDRSMQQRVWSRVYRQAQPGLSPQTIQKLQHCRRQAQQSARFYESMSSHGRYGDAFRHMARQASEHVAMIGQMLEK